MNKEKIPVAATDYRLEDFDGELLLYHPASTRTIHLNDSASIIWHLCDGKSSIQDIVDTIAEAYPESTDNIEKDVIQALNRLVEQGVLSLE
ncbi:MAG: pyrroloquinoline quinone biosynthesis peptide chaperone PqqD [Gammaproteobacteria bacterium]|nr:pyrroloquinoline quinone biosynthesis peptide chaperone PqqD [Gammaproteobacteria bacterium]